MIVLLILAFCRPVMANQDPPETGDDAIQKVMIADPYIELHTGPGMGYPIFYVVDRGETVFILSRRTDWYQIRAQGGKTGWASRQQMQRTLLPDGEVFVVNELNENDFSQRRWVLGASGGELKSAPVFTVFSAYSLTTNLAAEFAYAQSVGGQSSSHSWKFNLIMQPMPNLTYSPYFTLGLGRIRVTPSSTLIVPGKNQNTFSQFGLGIYRYISRRFLLRLEANEYLVFSSSNIKDSNEELTEWKIGFAIFF